MKTFALAALALAGCESSSPAPATLPAGPPKPPSFPPAPKVAAATPDDLPAQPKISEAAQRGIPAGGILVATRTDRHDGAPTTPAIERPDVFLLYKLTRAGAVEVAREEATTVRALAWLDHHTLLVYRETDAHEASLTRVVDGVPQAATAIPLAAWGLPSSPEGNARLVVAARNELWLTRCAKRVDPQDPDSKCTVPAALRIDAAPFVRTGVAPAADPARRVDQPRSGGHLERAALPSPAAPKGYTATLFSVPPAQRQNFMATYDKGFRCTGPDAKMEWPYGSDWIERQNVTHYRPSSVRWVSTTPPAYVVDGVATDMTGRATATTTLFHACELDPVLDAAYLGGDRSPIWAELDLPVGPGPGHGDDPPYVHATWQVRVADHKVATLVGSQTWFAPQPP